MRKIITSICFLFCMINMYAGNLISSSGEKLVLRAHYGLLTAGYANFFTADTLINGKQAVQTSLDFQTNGMVDKLYKIHYAFQSYYGENYLPLESSYHLIENKRTWNDRTEYNQEKLYLTSQINGSLSVSEQVRDITSAISYIRSIDWNQYQKEDTVLIYMYFREHEVFPLKVIYKGKETVSTDLGKFRCIKLIPMSDPGKLFNGKSQMNMYFSDDKNKIPVLFSVEVFIGSFKLDLIEYENIKYPLSAKLD